MQIPVGASLLAKASAHSKSVLPEKRFREEAHSPIGTLCHLGGSDAVPRRIDFFDYLVRFL
jgi:hypothetical protein